MSHFYNDQGQPCHTIIGKNGKERATTIRDARANGWVPSVTTVLSIIEKKELANWKNRQITDACYANPSIQKGKYIATPDEYARKMVEEAFKQVDDAADLGTLIHEAIEMHFEKKEYDFSREVEMPSGETVPLSRFVNDVDAWASANGVEVSEAELRLVNKKEGYAGLTDAVINRNGQSGILDFKSRKTKAGQKITPYDDWIAQIAAYHVAHYGTIDDRAIGCNLVISTTELGRIDACWYSADDLRKHWRKFQLCLSLWKIIKGYDPSTA